MDLVVVDTDVLSFIFKHDSRGAAYKPHLAGKEIIISFMTLAELNQWAIHSNWGTTRKQKLEAYRKPFTVFHSDEDLCLKWAKLWRTLAATAGRSRTRTRGLLRRHCSTTFRSLQTTGNTSLASMALPSYPKTIVDPPHTRNPVTR